MCGSILVSTHTMKLCHVYYYKVGASYLIVTAHIIVPLSSHINCCHKSLVANTVGLSLLCLKFYLLYSFWSFVNISPIILFYSCMHPIIAHLVTVADYSIRAFERSIRVYRSLRGIFSS